MPNKSVPADGEALPAANNSAFSAIGFAAAYQRSSRPQKLPFIDVASLPEKYAMEVSGSCMTGVIEHGDRLAFSTTEEFERGDIVIVFIKKEFVKEGELQAQVKQLVMPPPWKMKLPFDKKGLEIVPMIGLRMLNPNRSFMVDCSQLDAIHKCIGFIDDDNRLLARDFKRELSR